MTDKELIERMARLLAEDVSAREIAGREFAPAFDEMDPETREYWRCLARAALVRLETLSDAAGKLADIARRVSALGTVEELLTGTDPDFRDLTVAQRLEAMSTRRQERDQVVLDARAALQAWEQVRG